MSVRRCLPYLLALLLGMSTAVLTACGGGSTKGGVPSASAGELRSQITDVGQAVDGDRCPEVDGQLEQVDEAIEALPATTDNQLVSALRDGADRLRRVAVKECEEDAGTETTTTQTAPTETETTPTEPEPDPTETVPTQTTPPPTTTAPQPPPPTTTPTPPAPEPEPDPTPTPPAPPPVTPGGGVTPEIPDD